MKCGLFFLFLLSTFYFLLSTFPVSAQGLSLQISPVLYEVFLKPGEVKVISDFEFFNPLENSQEVNVALRDIVISDETGGLQMVLDSHSRYSLSKWLEVEPKKFNLGPREHKAVDLTIRLPDNAEPGGHYGALFGEVEPPPLGEEVSGVAFKAGVAGPILLTVAGPVSYSGEIIEFKKVPFVNLGPVNFLIRFKNTGTVHYKPHGIIEIFDWFGNKTDVVTVPEKRAFPETIRQLPATWNRRLLFGKYRAVATIYFGAEDERQDKAEISFWAFPYKLLFVLLSVGLLLWMVKKIKKKLKY
ncbi:hypothetical protein ES702_02729 [subsurface metagenome]